MPRPTPEGHHHEPSTHTLRATPALLLAGALAFFAAFTRGALAQEAPVPGMRPADVRRDALVDVVLVPSPGTQIEHATIIMRDGWIEAAGPMAEIAIPAGTTVHAGEGRRVFAGFIDPCVRLESAVQARAAASQQGAHWNPRVVPQLSTAELAPLTSDARKELRALGFTTAALYPSSGIFRGQGAVALLGEEARSARTIAPDAGIAVAFEHAGEGDWDRATYPGALIGSIALIRQTWADAHWFAACQEAWRVNPAGNQPPITANALTALQRASLGTQRVWFDATDEKQLLRAERIAAEFSLDAGFVGSGNEYRRLSEVRALGRPIIASFDFPAAPDVATPWVAHSQSLHELTHWALAPTNLAQLERAGIPASASTVRLKRRNEFAAAARRALEAGTTEDELLRALTINPARALNIDAIAGTVEAGKLANLVVCEGPLYGDDSKIREVWIAGVRHEVDAASRFSLRGSYELGTPVVEGRAMSQEAVAGRAPAMPQTIIVDAQDKRIEFLLPDSKSPLRATRETFDDARAGFLVAGARLGQPGVLRGTLVATAKGGDLLLRADDGASLRWSVPATARTGDAPKDDTKKPSVPPDGTKPDLPQALAAIPRTVPLADFGVTDRVAPRTVFVHDATLWTVGAEGIIEHGDMLVRDGKIVAVGRDLRATMPPDALPEETLVIEAAGMHLTPGLIDCHSHTGIDGGVNEWTQNVTAEVRIADAIDPDDINWYRELAGGLTAANQLHGSANPIGGQNSVVKLKWGHPAADFPIVDAPAGIKFALGENVVRRKGRYPGSRLGVEALLRDRFQSAREYAQALARYKALSADEQARTAPPPRDLELDALVEVLNGTRLVHCHSYRQDEIVMLLRLAEEFGFRVATLQHVLEGYKVADEIAKHGAGASSFSDWWAYKVEVMDAIPWNGQMLWKAGVVTSFNSDSDELARRLNTEAAKAIRYGALPPTEAIKFVTLNPAKQLRIDHRCGSLEVGKDADFVLWSADPLSVYARCVQTWIEGERLFDREADAAMRLRDAQTRRAILALAAADTSGREKGGRDAGSKRDDGDSPDDPASEPEAAPTLSRGGAAVGASAGGQSLLARMMRTRSESLMAQVRQGRDPSAIRPGECGCGDADVWQMIFEETAGEGGRR